MVVVVDVPFSRVTFSLLPISFSMLALSSSRDGLQAIKATRFRSLRANYFDEYHYDVERLAVVAFDQRAIIWERQA